MRPSYYLIYERSGGRPAIQLVIYRRHASPIRSEVVWPPIFDERRGASPVINVNVVSYMSLSYLDASPARAPPASLAFLVVSLPRPSQPIIWSLNDKCLRTTADRSPPTSHHVYTVIGKVEKYVVEMKIKRKVSPWSSLITERT